MKTMTGSIKLRLRDAAIAIVVMTSALVSCEGPLFGLGGQVDIGAPSVSIDAPSRNEYVKGTMTIGGSATDDLAVKSVSISILSKTGTLLGTYPATLSGEAYGAVIPTVGEGLEGEVVIEATVVDEGGKTTTTRTSVFIDNVAPTVLVTSPLTYGLSKPRLGDYIDIKGEVWDASPIGAVSVSLIDATDAVLKTQVAEGTNTWTTRFLLKGEIAALVDEQTYRYDVTVTDLAGNTSTYYFHRTDIYGLLNPGAMFPSMTEIGTLDQLGVPSPSPSGITVAELVDSHLGNGGIPTYGDFTYDADAKPEVLFTNLDKTALPSANLIGINAPVTGLIIPPPDTGAITNASFEAKLYAMPANTIIQTYHDTDILSDSDHVTITSLGDSASFRVDLVDGGGNPVPSGQYRLTVYAETQSGLQSDIVQAEFIIDSGAPTLTETTLGPGNWYRNAGFTLGGVATDGIGIQDIVIRWSRNSGIWVTAPLGTLTPPGGSEKNWTWSWTSPDVPALLDGYYEIEITLTTTAAKSVVVNRLITIDTVEPDITFKSPVPFMDGSAWLPTPRPIVVNGSTTIGAEVSDDSSVEIRRWIVPAADADPAWGTAGYVSWGPPPTSFLLNTNTLTNDTSYEIWVMARDRAGNEATTAQTIYVNQESDRPSISITSMDETAATNDVNGLGENPAILVTMQDDDMVDVSAVRYRIDVNNDGLFGATADLNNDTDTLDKWESELIWHTVEEMPLTDRTFAQGKILLQNFPQGVFRIEVEASDTAGTAFSTETSPVVRFSVDYGPPSIALTSPASGTYNTDIPVAGTATDALGIISVKYSFDNGATYATLYDVPAGPLTSVPFTDTIDISALSSGEYTLQVVASDKGGYTATQQIPITIDKTLPTVSYLSPAASSTVNGATLQVSGEAQDNRLVGAVFLWHGLASAAAPALPALEKGSTVPASSMVAGTRYSIATVGTTNFTLYGASSSGAGVSFTATGAGSGTGTLYAYLPGGYAVLAGTGVWSRTITTTAAGIPVSDGGSGPEAYRIRAVAIDAIGNVGTPLVLNVTVDQEDDRPDITFSNLDLVIPSRLGTGARIIGVVEDDDSVHKDKIEIRINRNGDADYDDADEDWVAVSNPPTGNSIVASWYHDISDVALLQGRKHVRVRAQDVYASQVQLAAVWNDSDYGWKESGSVEFVIDYGPPTLSLTSPASGAKFTVNAFTVGGTTNDGNGVDYVTIWVDDDGDGIIDAGELTMAGDGPGATQLTTDDTVYIINQPISGLGATPPVKPVQISSYDSAGAATVRDLTVVIDTAAPTASFNTPSAGATVNGTITLSGLANDNYQLANVYYSVLPTASAAPAYPAGYLLATGSYSWTTSIDTTSLLAGPAYTIRILPVDSAGNYPKTGADPDPYTRSIVVDQASDRPVVSIVTLNEAGAAVDNLLPGSLQISGTVRDDDSVDVSTIQARWRALPAGAFSVWDDISDQPDTDTALAVWNHSFTGFTDGQYEVEIRAADIYDAGTWGTYSSGTSATVKFAIDLSTPVSTITEPLNASYHNEDVTISGSASDANGIKKVTIAYKTGATYGPEITRYEDLIVADGYVTPYVWSASYAKSNGDGQVFFRVTVTDAFDKIRTYEQYFTIDTSGPTIAFQQPSAASTVNGTVQFRGTADDASQITGVWYKVNNAVGAGTWAYPADLAANGWILATGTYSWAFLRKTDSLADAAASAYLLAVDSAGNRSDPTQAANQLAFTVNQPANLPVISFTTGSGSTLLATDLITGTVSDDDGVDASTIEISFDSTDGIDGTWTPVGNPGSDGLFVSWSHSLAAVPERAAVYNVRVRATDIGQTFAFPNAAYNFPATDAFSGALPVYRDNGAPDLALDELFVQTRYIGGPDRSITSNFNGSYVNNDFFLYFDASDTAGIAAVRTSLDGTTWSAGLPLENLGAGPRYQATLSIALFADGNRTIYYKASDNRGKETSGFVTIIVDKTEPVVAFTNPAGMSAADAPNVNGDVLIQGTVSDSSAVASLAILGGNTGSQFALANSGNTINWKTTLAASGTYANATYATDQGSNVWRLPVELTVYDDAGNRTIATGNIDIAPDSDMPLITVVSPTSGDSVAGVFLLSGTVSDDDGALNVRLQVDLNNDTIYGVNGGFPGTLDLNGDGDVLDEFEDETVYKTITVNNGAWSLLLNSSGEFNKSNLVLRGLATATGSIGFKVIPVDINNTPGAAQTLSVYIDSEAPVIKGLAPDGTTEVNFPTPATNTLQKGSITVRALFRDDKDLESTSMQVSFNGGSSYQNISAAAGATISGDVDAGSTYAYRIAIPVDTSTIIAGGNGNLTIILKVTDKTYKQSSYTLEYSVDNTRPLVMWNVPGTISYVGTIPSETYSFMGDTDDADRINQLFGKAIDSGTVSGISYIDVYFVKNGNFESPKSAIAPLTVSNADLYRSGLDRNADGDYLDANEYAPAASTSSVPFTANADYVIRIDKRTELGAYDAIAGIGDQDGFNESLKAKSGYDEWYSFFDTTVFPDGPLTVYFVAYDEAGNASYDYAAAQMANHPPAIGSVYVGAQTVDDANNRAKVVGTVDFTINAGDLEGVTVADFKLAVTAKYLVGGGGSIGAEDTGFTDFYYGSSAVYGIAGWKAAFNTLTPPTGNATTATALASIDTTSGDFPSGYWYLFQAQAKDTDGNTVTRNFYVWVNNTDSSAPVVTMNDFTQTSVYGLGGHIEDKDHSPFADGDADLSGTVNVTGTVYDDTAVSELTLEVSYNGGSTWFDLASPVTSFGTAISGNPIDGYTYNWAYEWDSSTITNGAQLDMMVRAYATDGTNTTTDDADTDYYDIRDGRTVDIVPYMTDMSTGLDSGLRAYVKRSALGKYTVARGGADITILGYNFSASSTVTVGGVAATIVGTPSATAIVVDNLAALASGDVIVTTNLAASRNNSNDNSLSNNKEPNAYNPNLVDDRYIAFWDIASRAGTGTVAEPVMKVNSTRNAFDWMYTRNGKELWLNQSGSEFKVTQSTGLKGGDFTYTSSGSPVFIFNHNIQWTAYANTFSYTGGLQWGAIPAAWDWSTDAGVQPYAFTTDRDEAYNWHMHDGLPKLGLGNISFLTGTAPTTTWYPAYNDLDTSRYQSPLVRTVGADTGFRNYVAYFDANSAESRGIAFYAFWAGTSTATVTSGTNFYLVEDGTGNPQIVLNDAAPGPAANAEWYATIDKFHIKDPDQEIALAGTQSNMDGGIMTPRGRMEVTGVNSAANSSQFDLGVYAVNATTHYGYLAYFDEQASRLMIASKTDLYTSNPVAPGSAWSAIQVDANAGAYVKLAVDPDGGIHLAYQDTATGYLKYAYLTFNGSAFTIVRKVTVDALIGSGMFNSITIRDFGTADYRPVITTFSSAFVGSNAAFRVAYPVTSQASISNGANAATGAFTGTWESIAIPALSGIQASQGFTETDGATFSTGKLLIGYKGSLLEEAKFQEDTTRYAKRPDQP